MCSVRTPKPKTVEEKDPIYMRNPWLDGLGIGAESRGRNSLRIDMGTPSRSPTQSPPSKAIPPVSPPGGVVGGRRISGGSGDFTGRVLAIGQ